LLALTVCSSISAQAQFVEGYSRDTTLNDLYFRSIQEKIRALSPVSESAQRDIQTLIPSLTRSDRAILTPEAFAGHVNLADRVRYRYYPGLSSEHYDQYLLPLRLRYEHLTSAGWRPRLFAELNPLVDGLASTPEEAATTVLDWVSRKVEILGSSDVYPLGFKGDMDPVTTLRGGYGTEVDISILAVAALRSIGVAARLAYSPAIAGKEGGKLWVEYRGTDDWHGWSSSMPATARDARVWLPEKYGTSLSLVLCNPQNEMNITPAYVQNVGTVWFSPSPLVTNHFEYNLLVPGSDRFRVISGHDLYSGGLPKDFDFGVAPGSYLAIAGARSQRFAFMEIQLPSNGQGWLTTYLDRNKQSYTINDRKPEEFPWKGAYRRSFDPKAW
jgi:hypothetical protein